MPMLGESTNTTIFQAPADGVLWLSWWMETVQCSLVCKSGWEAQGHTTITWPPHHHQPPPFISLYESRASGLADPVFGPAARGEAPGMPGCGRSFVSGQMGERQEAPRMGHLITTQWSAHPRRRVNAQRSVPASRRSRKLYKLSGSTVSERARPVVRGYLGPAGCFVYLAAHPSRLPLFPVHSDPPLDFDRGFFLRPVTELRISGRNLIQNQ